MSLATFCIIVGIYEIMIGLPLVVKPQETANWFEGVIKNDPLLRLIGFLLRMPVLDSCLKAFSERNVPSVL